MVSAKETILVVDDEEDILRLLEYNLTRAGYSCTTAADGPEAMELARTTEPSLIVLDIMLPNMSGTEVLKHLKADAKTSSIPVIMLTAKGEEVDRVVGFELGAEDYITKPFSPRELVLRVRAVLKRAGGVSTSAPGKEADDDPEVSAIGTLTIDRTAHRVTISGKRAELSATEFGLLSTLASNPGRVFTRDNLLDKVWGTECFVTPRTVDTHIRRLRVKLGKAGDYIETVRGVGYRFAEKEPDER